MRDVRHMVARRLRPWLLRRPRPARGILAGLRVRGPLAAHAAGDYEAAVASALERLVRAGFICADVGAYAGYFTLVLARLVGDGGRVYAFEASPENAACIAANVSLNGFDDRVVIETAAVVDAGERSVALYAGRSAGSASEWTISRSFAAREDAEPVTREPALYARAVALDDYFRPGSRLDLVKMDVEGAESQALAGMRRLLREARPVVVLEFHRELGWGGVETLLDAGYVLEGVDGNPLPPPSTPDDVPYHVVARPGKT